MRSTVIAEGSADSLGLEFMFSDLHVNNVYF